MCDRLSANNVYPYFVYIKLKSQLLLHIKLKLISKFQLKIEINQR